MNTSFKTIRYLVTYKEEPQQAQQKADFSVAEAAYAFAITIENNGGIAVVTPVTVNHQPLPKILYGDSNDL